MDEDKNLRLTARQIIEAVTKLKWQVANLLAEKESGHSIRVDEEYFSLSLSARLDKWFALPEPIRLENVIIIRLISKGKTYKEIGPVVNLSVRTIEGRIYRLCELWGCRNNSHVVGVAFRLNIIK